MPLRTALRTAWVACAFCSLCVAAEAAREPDASDLPACLAKLRKGAREEMVSLPDFDRLTRGVRWQDKSIEHLNSQPETMLTWQQYLDRILTPSRVDRGRGIFVEWRRSAASIAERYGSDANVIVAIWGIESDFGSRMGSFPVLDSWATLACYRPTPLRTRNFYGALRLLASDRVPVDGFTGSWSGAFGLTQFIPTSYESYAADGDGDGRVDLYNSVPDAMASAARHLAGRTHWTRGLPAAIEVTIPAKLVAELAAASDDERWVKAARPLVDWARLNVTTVDGQPLSSLDIPSSTPMQVLLTAGARGRTFLLSSNFQALMSYNRSTKYAVAVSELANRVREPIASTVANPPEGARLAAPAPGATSAVSEE